MASGVAAIVRNLPAGSPSVFYCIHSLVEKANSLCGILKSEEPSKKNFDVDWDPCKKILELLIRLLSFIDIQASGLQSLSDLSTSKGFNFNYMYLTRWSQPWEYLSLFK